MLASSTFSDQDQINIDRENEENYLVKIRQPFILIKIKDKRVPTKKMPSHVRILDAFENKI